VMVALAMAVVVVVAAVEDTVVMVAAIVDSFIVVLIDFDRLLVINSVHFRFFFLENFSDGIDTMDRERSNNNFICFLQTFFGGNYDEFERGVTYVVYGIRYMIWYTI